MISKDWLLAHLLALGVLNATQRAHPMQPPPKNGSAPCSRFTYKRYVSLCSVMLHNTIWAASSPRSLHSVQIICNICLPRPLQIATKHCGTSYPTSPKPTHQKGTPYKAWLGSVHRYAAAPTRRDTRPVYVRHTTLQGQWREVATRCRLLLASPQTASLPVATFHVLSLVKLKLYHDGAVALSGLGPPTEDWPFALRVLRAELPEKLGNSQATLDHLYSLLASLDASGAPSRPEEVTRHRRRAVTFALVQRHVAQSQFVSALRLLNGLLREDPSDGAAWSQAGRVQLLLGDVSAAAASFNTAAAHITPQEAHANTGLLLFCQHKYGEAAQAFTSGAAMAHVSGINGAAVARVYTGDLSGAVAILESGFRQQPAGMLMEPVVLNAASLYEMGGTSASLEAKSGLAAWVSRCAPDDLDLACCKMGPAS